MAVRLSGLGFIPFLGGGGCSSLVRVDSEGGTVFDVDLMVGEATGDKDRFLFCRGLIVESSAGEDVEGVGEVERFAVTDDAMLLDGEQTLKVKL